MDSASSLDMSNFGSTFGAIYIGAMVMMALYGVTCLQTYLIFIRYPNDRALNRCLVLTIWLLDTSHVCLVGHAMYQYLIRNYANPSGLVNGTWSLYLSLGINVLIAFVVQCFFTLKIHDLSGKNWWMTTPLIVFVLLHLAFGLVTMGEFYKLQRLDTLTKLTYFAALPYAIFAVFSDIVIAVALCWLLHANKTSYKATNVLINHLILFAINRCLLTTAMSIVEVVFYAIMPSSYWFLAVDFIVGKCYANSLLATLNSRSALRRKGMDLENSPMRFSTVMGIEHARISRAMALPHGAIPTTIASESECTSESGSGNRSAGARTGATGSTGERTVKHVSRTAGRPIAMTQVERLSVNRLSVNRLSVNLGNLEFAPGPLSGSVSEEADISDAGLETPSIKEDNRTSFIIIGSPSRGSLDLDVDEFFSIHEADAL